MSTLSSTIVKTKSLGEFNPIHVYVGDVDYASVTNATISEQDIAVAGLGSNDIVLSCTVKETGLGLTIANYWVKAAGVLTVALSNPTAAPVDPAATITMQIVAAAA